MLKIHAASMVLLILLLSCAFAQGEEAPRVVRVHARAATDSVQLMEEFEVELQVRIRSPWHINSEAPEMELLLPTSVKLDHPDQVELVAVRYPKGKKRRFPYHNKPLRVFEDRFPIKLTLRIKEGVEPGPRRLEGALNFQACSRNSCQPPDKATFSVELVVDEPPERPAPQLVSRMAGGG